MATETQVHEGGLSTLERILEKARVSRPSPDQMPMLRDNFTVVADKESGEDERFVSSLAALVYNANWEFGKFEKGRIQEIIQHIDELVDEQLNEVLHNDDFQALESAWRGLDDLISNVNFQANIVVDILDVSKEDLGDDLMGNSIDIAGSALFNKVYVAEYDQYGGRPIGALIGLYSFNHTREDIAWLRVMAKIANASHAPFISSVSPKFFGVQNAEEAANIKDLEGLMNHPRYSDWNAFRETDESAYIGLTFPNYVLRLPWNPESNPSGNLAFHERAMGDKDGEYLWGNSALLLARNMARSFESTGWCQYLRGPKGGGLVNGLPVHTVTLRGEEQIKVPVEILIPDFRELEFAKCGFIPLVYRKGTGDACFFSVQSLKKVKKFEDPMDSQNSALVANLSYSFSITRIAHYVKSIMRDNIGSSADAGYIQTALSAWLNQYVTTVVSPDDLTLRYYPFKSVDVKVTEAEGELGWYKCSISVLPHIQFEGMDVELRLDARLG